MRNTGRARSAARKQPSSYGATALPVGIIAATLLLAAVGVIEMRITGPAAGVVSGAAGVTSLGLLSISVVLGAAVAVPGALSAATKPVVRRLHQTVATLAGIVLALHLWAAISIPFFALEAWRIIVPIPLDGGPNRFTAYGAIAFDLLIAVLVTSAILGTVMKLDRLRPLRRASWRVWRLVHWCVYPLSAAAMIHVWMVPTRTSAAEASLKTYVLVCAMVVSSALICRIILASNRQRSIIATS